MASVTTQDLLFIIGNKEALILAKDKDIAMLQEKIKELEAKIKELEKKDA